MPVAAQDQRGQAFLGDLLRQTTIPRAGRAIAKEPWRQLPNDLFEVHNHVVPRPDSWSQPK